MNDIEFYGELIEKIATLKKENIELRVKLGDCEGQLKILNRFYSDFKHPNRNEVILKDTILSEEINPDIASTTTDIIKTAPEYDMLLGEYLFNGNVDILKHLFEDFGVHPAQILTDIRNKLPDNIVDLVKQYKCKNEYNIILKSIRNIKRFTKATHFVERDIMDLVNSYINYYNRGDKEGALKFLKQTLVYFPFQFYKFLDNTRQYKYDDLDQYIENLKFKLYGKNNILLNNKDYIPESKKVKLKIKPEKVEVKTETEPEKLMLKGKSHIKLDYGKLSVDVLVKMVQNVKNKFGGSPHGNNSRQKALQIVENMKKHNRTEEECLQFVNEANKLLRKKIII